MPTDHETSPEPPSGSQTLSPEELEAEHADATGEPEQEGVDQQLIYTGEQLTSSMTLAVLLPGDHKESYFGSKFTARLQEGEEPDELAGRVITVVRETVIGQLDDAIDAVADYQQALTKSGRLKD